jgi:hypothetical protein
MEPKVVCNLQGLLGNIMFQIAAVKSHCDRRGYSLEFSGFNDIPRNYPGKDLRLLSLYPYTIFSNLNNEFNFKSSIERKQINEDNGLFQNLDFIEAGNYLLQGYFQNKNLFGKHEAQSYFKFDKITIPDQIDKMLRNENCVSVHVRRTDYLHVSQVLPSLGVNYYNNALDEIKNYDKILFFSDDISWCKENFKMNNSHFVEENELVSLKIMQYCQSNVIANSTFSWWGAFLNNNNNQVVMPKTWFGPAVADPRPMNHLRCTSWKAI